MGISRLLRRVLALVLCQPLVAQSQTPRLQPRQLRLDFILLVGNLMGLALLGPEVGDGEAFLEVGAEVVHVSDGEKDVEAELQLLVSPSIAVGM